MRGRVEREERDEGMPRRRREGIALEGGRRLPVPTALTADKRYMYRIVNDNPGRVRDLYMQDWDVVMPDGSILESEPGFDQLGTHLHVAGRHADGSPIKTVLMRKLRPLFEEDRRKKMEPVDEAERQMKQGMVRGERGFAHDADVEAREVSIRSSLNR
jgi:hypothetical protein